MTKVEFVESFATPSVEALVWALRQYDYCDESYRYFRDFVHALEYLYDEVEGDEEILAEFIEDYDGETVEYDYDCWGFELAPLRLED